MPRLLMPLFVESLASANEPLATKDQRVLVFEEEGSQQPAPAQS